VNLNSSIAQSGGDAQGDVLSNISNLVGSDFADTLTGTSSANTLSGGKGDDKIIGGGGADSLVAGDGVDTLTGGAGVDTFDLYTGNNSLAGDKALSGVGTGVSGGGDTFIINANQMNTIDSLTQIQGTSGGADTLRIMGTAGATLDLTTLSSTALTSIVSINTLDVSLDGVVSSVKLNFATIQGLVDASSGIPTLTIKLGTGDTIDFQNETHVSFRDDVAKTIKIYDSVNGNLNPLAQINF
jgi:Ca2+-binding RTX toxin-like protein